MGQGEANCGQASNRSVTPSLCPCVREVGLAQTTPIMQVYVVGDDQEDIAVDLVVLPKPPDDNSEFGPWLKPRSRRGPAKGQGGG